MRYLIIVYFIFSTISAAAANESKLKAVYLMEGECQKLSASGKDLPCLGKMMQSEYDDGKLGFYFLRSDTESAITFSGFGPDQIKQGDNSIEQPIRRLINTGKSFYVEGRCIYENPFLGVATLSCDAVSNSGDIYRSRFLTNGEPPKILRY